MSRLTPKQTRQQSRRFKRKLKQIIDEELGSDAARRDDQVAHEWFSNLPRDTRRERIATAALQGILASGKEPSLLWTEDVYMRDGEIPACWYAVNFADALIKKLDEETA